MLPLTVTDIRQFVYCPRVVYFTYVQPLERPTTFKMEHGLSAEEKVSALEQRRTTRRYGLAHAERLLDVWLHAPALGLSGRADMLLLTPTAVYPVEFKHTDEGLTANHRLQLTAYAMMAEDTYARSAPHGFIVHLARPRTFRVAVGALWRQKVIAVLERIREMVDSERFPDPPAQRGKCRECEFRRFCGDV